MEVRRYAKTTCPTCGEALEPLPKSKKKCSFCGQAIYVRSGPDGITYLLAQADLAAHEARWEAHRAEQERQWAQERRAEAARLTSEALREYIDAGIGAIEISATEDACQACRALHGRRFDPRSAPPIPVPGCTNLICRCDYTPEALRL